MNILSPAAALTVLLDNVTARCTARCKLDDTDTDNDIDADASANGNPIISPESIKLEAAQGRIAAQSIVSARHIPESAISMMDGYAVASRSVLNLPLPVTRRIVPGQASPEPLPAGEAARIFTGAVVPGGADAVVMQEHAQIDNARLTLTSLPQPGQWIRQPGSDLAIGEQLIRQGQRLTTADLALLASVGIATVSVMPKLQVALVSNGPELVLPGQALSAGQAYDSNRFLLSGWLSSLPIEIEYVHLPSDDVNQTRDALMQLAQRCDVIVSSGGISVGETDTLASAMEQLGDVLICQVAMKPGRPFKAGWLQDQQRTVLFLGLPGNPVSAGLTCLLFVRPALLALSGMAIDEPGVQWPVWQYAKADFDWPTPDLQRYEYLRVQQGLNGQLMLHPQQRSSTVKSLAWCNALVGLTPGQVVKRGDTLAFWPMCVLCN